MPEAGVAPRPWVLFSRRLAAPRVRLLCLPYAGGGASAYRTWPAALAGDGIEVWPVQLPGRENRLAERPAADLAGLTTALVDQLAPALADGVPYAVFGHSFGARVGFEFAQEMRRRGGPGPVLLMASAHRPPQVPDPEPPVHLLPRGQLLAKLESYGGTDAQVFADPELVELVLPGLLADLRLFEGLPWTPAPPLECPIIALHGTFDASVRPAELHRWAELTTAPFELRTVAGPHLFLLAAADAVLAIVRHGLRPAVVAGSPG